MSVDREPGYNPNEAACESDTTNELWHTLWHLEEEARDRLFEAGTRINNEQSPFASVRVKDSQAPDALRDRLFVLDFEHQVFETTPIDEEPSAAAYRRNAAISLVKRLFGKSEGEEDLWTDLTEPDAQQLLKYLKSK